MIEKFFEMDKLLLSFVITIVITTIFSFILSVINIEIPNNELYVFIGIVFTVIKLVFAYRDTKK